MSPKLFLQSMCHCKNAGRWPYVVFYHHVTGYFSHFVADVVDFSSEYYLIGVHAPDLKPFEGF